MATPYLQMFVKDVPSTQDLARSRLESLPQVVVAAGQSAGRGRSGAPWANADRALAVSVAWLEQRDSNRPFSLMAGVAAVRILGSGTTLKWPNDIILGDKKLGGILVERSGSSIVAGMGLNLYWPEPPPGATALNPHDPGESEFKELGALWAAEVLALIDSRGWPRDEYRRYCSTLGQKITWEPDGRGLATDVSDSGALIVETESGVEELVAGAVHHLR